MSATARERETIRQPLECGAPHEDADLNGMYCELPPGHLGDHAAMVEATWPKQEP